MQGSNYDGPWTLSQVVKEESQDMGEARTVGGKGWRINGLEDLVGDEIIGIRF